MSTTHVQDKRGLEWGDPAEPSRTVPPTLRINVCLHPQTRPHHHLIPRLLPLGSSFLPVSRSPRGDRDRSRLGLKSQRRTGEGSFGDPGTSKGGASLPLRPPHHKTSGSGTKRRGWGFGVISGLFLGRWIGVSRRKGEIRPLYPRVNPRGDP